MSNVDLGVRGAGPPLRELLLQLVEKARELTGARYGALGVIEPGQPGLREFHYSGISSAQAEKIGRFPSGGGLLGAVVKEGRTIRVADLRADPRFAGMPPEHPQMTSFLGVPLRVDRTVFGNFYLADKPGGAPFTEEDERLVEQLASRAALAVGYAQQAAELEEKREMLEVLLEQAPVGILLFDAPQGNVVFANETLRRILGRPVGPTGAAEERPGLSLLQHADGRPLRLDELPSWRALQGEVVVGAEFETVRPDGRHVALAINAAPFRRGGRIAGAVVAAQDVSDRRHLERLRDEFRAIVAHDLRHPLTVMDMWTDIVLRRVEHGVASVPAEELEVLRRNVDRLERMIDDLLDASRVDVGRLDLEPRTLAVPAALERLLEQLRPTLAEHVVEITVRGAPLPVRVDPARFDQIVTNLLSNAMKYSGRGTRIQITVEAADGGTSLSVADEGAGVPAEELPLLFDRFYRTKNGRARKGLGLGLHITKGLVEAHGGRISVESTLGRGSTFHVWLPEGSR